MELIDELIPLTAEEIKLLEAKRILGGAGCGVYAILFVIIAAISLVFFINASVYVAIILAVVSLSFFGLVIFELLRKPREDKSIALDIAGGKKRRIVAPIVGKDIIYVWNGGRINPPSTFDPPYGFADTTTLIDLNPYENKIDIVEKNALTGKYLNEVAPVREYSFLSYAKFESAIKQNNRWMTNRASANQTKPKGSTVYLMQIQEFIFTISEEDYLSGLKKGDFVEFSLCPNSKRFISLPEKVPE